MSKNLLCRFAVSLLLGPLLAGILVAQDESAAEKRMETAVYKTFARAYAEGNGSAFQVINPTTGIPLSLNISEEQRKTLEDFGNAQFEPLNSGAEEWAKTWANEPDPQRRVQMEEELSQSLSPVLLNVQTVFEDNLNPEQLSSLREMETVLPPLDMENGLVVENFKAYEALGLSEEQKAALNELKESALRDFDADVEEYVNLPDEVGVRGRIETHDDQGNITSTETYVEFHIDCEMVRVKIDEKGEPDTTQLYNSEFSPLEANEALSKRVEERVERSKSPTDTPQSRFIEKKKEKAKLPRLKIANLLTAEQKAKWKKLMLKASEDADDALWAEWDLTNIASGIKDAWKYAWKPGDPVPESEEKPQAARFPVKKTKTDL